MNIPLVNINNADNNDIVASRISFDDDDDSLFVILKKGKVIMNFLQITGVNLITNDNDHIIWRLLARIWQISLLLLGGINFVWETFVFGSYNAETLNQALLPSNDDATSLSVFVDVGELFFGMIVPILQVFSLMYGVYHVRKVQLHKPVNSIVISKLLPRSCRDAIIFYTSMALASVIFNSITITPIQYDANYGGYDDGYLKRVGLQSYPLYSLFASTCLFYNLANAGYLSIVMMFVSLEFKEAILILLETIDLIEKDQLGGEKYMKLKTKVLKIRDDSYMLV